MSDSTPPLSYTFEIPSRPETTFHAPRRQPHYWLHILLFLLTVLTTLIVGARLQFNFNHNLPAFSTESYTLPLFLTRWIWKSPGQLVIELPFPLKWALGHPSRLFLGVPFSVTLMGILLAHEMGHYIYCERNNVYATLPYFIPGPIISPIGTFGAVIRIKSHIRSRQALFDIGIAGPIGGFIVAVPVLLCGLALSKPLPPQASASLIDFGYPLIFRLSHNFIRLFSPHMAPLQGLYLHPIAVAAWVGMFATALNLLPGGQFDGGHIIYAFSPRVHKLATRISVVVLAFLGLYWPAWGVWTWPGWLIWAIILGLTGWRHPNVPKWPDLDPTRRRLALLAVLMLVLTFVLAPVRGAALNGN